MSPKPSPTSKPPEVPVLYLDENFGVKPEILAELEKYSSVWKIERHRTHFPHDSVPDDDVLEFCGKHGWILITKDDKLRVRHAEAAKKYNVKVFLFSSGNYRGMDYVAALICARNKIVRMIQKRDGHFFARITMEGKVFPLGEGEYKAAKDMTSAEKTAQKYGKVAENAEVS
jgi:hypothetical protein